MSPRISQNLFSVRTFRAALGFAALALLTAAAPAAHAQDTLFDTDGETIGVVPDGAAIGTVNTSPFTVYTNAATVIGSTIGTANHSTLEMNGGSTGDNMGVFDSSTVNLRAGSVGGGVYASGGTFNMSGGLVGYNIYCFGNAVANISGGTFLSDLVAKDSGVMSVFGTGLSKTLLDANYDIGDGQGYVYSEYALAGFLQDGTDITGKIALISNDLTTFNLVNSTAVPEPGSVAFGVIMAGSVLGLLKRKRREKTNR